MGRCFYLAAPLGLGIRTVILPRLLRACQEVTFSCSDHSIVKCRDTLFWMPQGRCSNLLAMFSNAWQVLKTEAADYRHRGVFSQPIVSTRCTDWMIWSGTQEPNVSVGGNIFAQMLEESNLNSVGNPQTEYGAGPRSRLCGADQCPNWHQRQQPTTAIEVGVQVRTRCGVGAFQKRPISIRSRLSGKEPISSFIPI